jgi:hypothetical protein
MENCEEAWISMKEDEKNRMVLIEKHDIKYMQVSYLTTLKKYQEEGCPIVQGGSNMTGTNCDLFTHKQSRSYLNHLVYTDKTYIHSSPTRPKNWSDSSASGLLAPVSTGEQLMILPAGGSTGFIPNTQLIFKSNQRNRRLPHRNEPRKFHSLAKREGN